MTDREVYAKLDEMILARPCGYCGALPFGPCRTKGGRRTTYIHNDRHLPVYEPYWLGRTSAREELLGNPNWYAELRARWVDQHPEATARADEPPY